MGFVFVICIIGMIVISLIDQAKGISAKGLEIDRSMFKPHVGFVIGGLLVLLLTTAFYMIYW